MYFTVFCERSVSSSTFEFGREIFLGEKISCKMEKEKNFTVKKEF
jgi:hypothetical protein